MNTRKGVITLMVALFAASSFAGTTAPKAPKRAPETDQTVSFGDAMAKFKEAVGHPSMAGMCDKKGETYATHIVVWDMNAVQLFEIENSGKKFYYIRSGPVPRGFYQENKGKYEEIPLDKFSDVLRSSGASQFLTSIDASEENSDCVAKKLEPGVMGK